MISVDSAYVHKAWADAAPSIAKIEYPMLADQRHELAKHFDVYDEASGCAYRGTFIMNPDGVVVAAEIQNVETGRSAAEALRKVQSAQFVAQNTNKVCPASWRPGMKTIEPVLELIGKL